ncbi:MAG: fructose PTS transporter subunit IIB [Bacillota bacterium]
MKVIAITACATGVAHTYMAAAALKKAAKALGHEIKVETQGAMGIEDELSAKDIAAADAVIFAVDTMVSKRERFADKKSIEVLVGAAIKDPKKVIADSLA